MGVLTSHDPIDPRARRRADASALALAVSLALASIGACRTPPPRYAERNACGIARADDLDLARELAALGAELAPPVCAVLGVAVEPPFEIHYVPELAAAGLMVARDGAGRVTARRIEIGAVAVRDQARFVLAHELVHWYASGPWERLPHALEEGLADHVALELAPEWRAVREAEHAATLASIDAEKRARALALTEREWAVASADSRSAAYAVGFELVRAHGVAGLLALCERAEREGLERVPLAWLEAPTVASQSQRD